ncbi:MAG: ABC transporter permease [Eubacteriales bacterium]|nr:ABC transporter permease [Eubacteriales bacterium]
MVTKKRTHARRGTRALRTKLLRDIRQSGMQFAALLLLCALATWVFGGLDANWRVMDVSFETYFSQTNLADLWIKGSGFTDRDIAQVEQLPGVEEVLPKAVVEANCPRLGDGVSVAVNAFDGEMSINTPYIREGSALNEGDLRGVLVEEQFAQAQGIALGDELVLDIMGREQTFIVKGIVLSPEYVVTSKGVSPDPEHYGFVLLNRAAVSDLPQNELVVRLAEGADPAAAQREIESMLVGTAVITQKTSGSVSSARSFVVLFRSLSYVFPVLAYSVAAMIVVSTLRRMIEKERIQIGTLKSLGYTDRQIRRHYLSYALIPSAIGSFAGLFLGIAILPGLLWDMVCVNIRVPETIFPPISLLSWAMTLLTIALSLFICMHAYNVAARESTAELLRPRPPKSGSRIFLERFTRLWGRLGFNSKMVVRNLMRNKGRTLMAMAGMLCCNMLIICSFGLQESIPAFIRDYYMGVLDYDVRADLDPYQAGTLESYRERLPAERIDGVMERSVSLRSDGAIRASMLTVLPEEQQLIRLGEGHTVLPLPESGVVLSTKLAELMQVQAGDTIEMMLTGDDEAMRVRVEQVVEINIGQSLYMSKTAWENCRKGPFAATALLIKEPGARTMHLLQEMDEFSELTYPVEQNEGTNRFMESTTTIFSVMTGVALGLAFVICYNMGLMNFTERVRDYATLKVLGYHQKEIRSLMMRENDLTAVIAVLLGIYPGILLVDIILGMVNHDSMIFTSAITLKSILGACAITFLFSRFIEWLLTRKVPTIDMVEALKSVE